MKSRSVVAPSLATALAAVGVVGLVRLASAAPPAGYKCGKGGKKNVAKERCDCPAGKRPSRSGDGEAVCKPKRRGDPPPVAQDDPPVGAPPASVRPTPLPVRDDAAEARTTACSRDMVAVPGRTFQMGSPAGVGDDDERPQHQVTLSPYCIDRTEVTVAAYEACGTCTSAADTVDWPGIDDATRKLWNDARACNGNRADRQDHPANCITWTQADAYCRAVGKRLPTEAQWELAARGTDGRRYPWGIKAPSARRLNACGSECRAYGTRLGQTWAVMFEDSDGHETTAPVGSYPDGASPYVNISQPAMMLCDRCS